ncbi:MAG: glycosyltransferase family A protein [Pseudomonadota bacterium]
MNNEYPLVSCLCVTHNRTHYLASAIKCFRSQTYQNKELVIVHLESDEATTEYGRSLSDDNIRVIAVDDYEHETLGDVRNRAIQEAKGSYICNWDDDDWYHNERIATQIAAIKDNGKEASILLYLLMYDHKRKNAYITHRRDWENSYMCSKNILKTFGISYPSLNKREDSPFIEKLKDATAIFPIVKPQLYVYSYTGQNTCGDYHFDSLFQYAHKLPEEQGKLLESIMNGEIADNKAAQLLNDIYFLSALNYG